MESGDPGGAPPPHPVLLVLLEIPASQLDSHFSHSPPRGMAIPSSPRQGPGTTPASTPAWCSRND